MSLLYRNISLFLLLGSHFILCAIYEEIPSVRYELALLHGNRLRPSKNADQTEMVLSGERFLCYHREKRFDANNKMPDTSGKFELPLDMPCLEVMDTIWIYRFCEHNIILQINIRNRQQFYVLGVYSNNSYSMKSVQGYYWQGRKLVFSEFYVNGTVCDVTGQNRRAEVRFYCRESNGEELSSVMEHSLCNYILHVYTNRVCSVHGIENDVMNPILCYAQSYINIKELAITNEKYSSYLMEDREFQDILQRGSYNPSLYFNKDGAIKELKIGLKTMENVQTEVLENSIYLPAELLNWTMHSNRNSKEIKVKRSRHVKQQDVRKKVRDLVFLSVFFDLGKIEFEPGDKIAESEVELLKEFQNISSKIERRRTRNRKYLSV